MTVSGAAPGGLAALFMNTGGLYCSAPVIQELPVQISLVVPLQVMGGGLIPASGNLTVNVLVPLGFPPGLSVWMQWLVMSPTSRPVTEGIAIILDIWPRPTRSCGMQCVAAAGDAGGDLCLRIPRTSQDAVLR